MTEFVSQLGLDIKLLIAQAVNFLLLLVILRAVAYKPLVAILAKRKQVIEEGVKKAEQAEEKLQEAYSLKKEKLQEAERESLEMMRATETKAKQKESQLLEEAHQKESTILKNAEVAGRRNGGVIVDGQVVQQ